MAIIMRSNGQKRDQGDNRKQLYTWVGCGLVIVLTLISVVPNMGGEKKPDYSKFSSSRQQDLAALPFGTDAEAGSFLRDNPEYAAISNEDLLGSLFSSEDRKERQAKDKAEGVPPPPDPEYREIAEQKEKTEEAALIREARMQKRQADRERIRQEKERISMAGKNNKSGQQVRSQKQTTTPQTLATGSRAGSGGSGSSGVTGSIWRYEGKDIKTGSGSSAIGNHAANAQDIAFAKNKGRGVGLDVAAIESLKGANAADADAAAAGAIDAFQGEVEPEDLEKDEQELGLEELPEGINEDLQNDLKRELNDDVNKQESSKKNTSDTSKGKDYNVNENCMDTKGNFVSSCYWNKLWTNALNSLIDKGFDCVTSGCWTNWKKSSSVSNYTVTTQGDTTIFSWFDSDNMHHITTCTGEKCE